MFKQGPYWVEPTEQGYLRCTPRRGTRAYKRMLARQAQQKEVQSGAWLLVALAVAWAFAALFKC
jgi:hypothetical protein